MSKNQIKIIYVQYFLKQPLLLLKKYYV